MTFILVPASGEDLVINGWNWRPTVALLVRAGILPAGKRAECCSAQGCGGYLSSAEALRALLLFSPRQRPSRPLLQLLPASISKPLPNGLVFFR